MKSLSTGQIAEYCDVTLRTVIRWIEKGHLKGYKLPGRGNNRVLPEDFVDFLQQQNMPVPDEFRAMVSVQARVLIVDDDVQMAKSIQRVIRRMGLDNDIAHNGFEAGHKLLTFQPTLMLLDLQMPDMNGFEVIEAVRINTQLPQPKIIAISALSSDRLQHAVTLGADQYLSKPFDNKDLEKLVNELVNP